MDKTADLVIRVGNSSIAGAFFSDQIIIDTFRFGFNNFSKELLKNAIQNKNVSFVLIGADNRYYQKIVEETLKELQIDFSLVNYKNVSIKLDVENPSEIGMARIANAYGALFLHPFSDIIIIDMATALTIDVITKDRVFLGGVICPSISLSAKALSEHTDKLPLVEIKKPKSCLSRSLIGNIQSGIYYGLIGTIEKVVEEIISLRFSHSEINIIATGGLTGSIESLDPIAANQFRSHLEKDLKVVIDYFEPDLTFFGLYQILEEKLSRASKEKIFKI